jgi:Putative peptidoglycan binding domain
MQWAFVRWDFITAKVFTTVASVFLIKVVLLTMALITIVLIKVVLLTMASITIVLITVVLITIIFFTIITASSSVLTSLHSAFRIGGTLTIGTPTTTIYANSDYSPVYDYRYWYGLATAVQTELAARGYYHGQIDGVIGSDSRHAIQAFQEAKGLPVTGMINPGLLKALNLPQVPRVT